MRRTLAIGAIALAGLGLAVAYYLFQDRGVPSAETIKEIEAQVVLPEGAHPLANYLRFYAYGWRGWKSVVVGSYQYLPGADVFIKQSAREGEVAGLPGAFALQQPPTFYVGETGDRCQVVFLHYDEAAKRLIPFTQDGKVQLAWCAGEGPRMVR